MPALIFLVLVGLFAHSVFIPAGPVSKPEAPQPKIVVINTAGQVIDTWQQNTKGEIVIEVPVEDVVLEEIAEAEPVEVPAEYGEETDESDEDTPDETPVEEEVTEETFEAPPIVEDPVLVIEEEETDKEQPEEQNLVEVLLEE